jgi:hypothetical protein
MSDNQAMDTATAPFKEIFDQLFTLLEGLETQTIALQQFLNDERIATDQKLAPYLERAASASNVKWRAARLRMEYLFSPMQMKMAEETSEEKKSPEKRSEEKKFDAKKVEAKKNEAKESDDKKPAQPNLQQNGKQRPPSEGKSEQVGNEKRAVANASDENAKSPERVTHSDAKAADGELSKTKDGESSKAKDRQQSEKADASKSKSQAR